MLASTTGHLAELRGDDQAAEAYMDALLRMTKQVRAFPALPPRVLPP